MSNEMFGNIIGFLKGTAPMSIVFNAVFGTALLIVGISLLKKRQQTNQQKVGGWICVCQFLL